MTYQAPVVATGAFTAATQLSSIIKIRGGSQLAVSVYGTFSGTVQLRRTLTKSQPVDATGSGIKASWTAPVETSFPVGATAWFFLYCSARASGTIGCAIRSDYDAPGLFQAEAIESVTVGALNDATTPLLVKGGGWVSAQRLASGFSGTVVLERSFDGGATWGIIDADVVNEDYQMGATCLVRVRCSAYISSTAQVIVAVGQGQ